MKKNILIISSSLRANSNSEALADSFAKGAQEAGHYIKQISLKEKSISFCRGCLACQNSGNCTIRDDATEIVQMMHDADAIAFATPIYYYGLSGQLKTLLDRGNSLYGSDYAFRDIYLLSSAAEDEPETDRRAVTGLEGWIVCFERARLAGTVFAGGVTAPGDIHNHPALQTAYDMGKNLQ